MKLNTNVYPWVGRDLSGALNGYTHKPVKLDDEWVPPRGEGSFIGIHTEEAPLVSWSDEEPTPSTEIPVVKRFRNDVLEVLTSSNVTQGMYGIIQDLAWSSDFMGDEVGFDDVEVVGCYRSEALQCDLYIDTETMKVLAIFPDEEEELI